MCIPLNQLIIRYTSLPLPLPHPLSCMYNVTPTHHLAGATKPNNSGKYYVRRRGLSVSFNALLRLPGKLPGADY